jgi:hypothetical protein
VFELVYQVNDRRLSHFDPDQSFGAPALDFLLTKENSTESILPSTLLSGAVG